MGEYEFVGDISELSEEQKALITSAAADHGFSNGKINVEPVGEAGDNYVANVKRITVEKDGNTFKMIAKVAPKLDFFRAMGNTAVLFLNENFMYTHVLPKFTELEKAANIPENERLRYASCYGTYGEEPNEIILLEDMEIPGFNMLDRFTSLSDDVVRLVLKNFAILHSLSYVLKHQEPETFERFCKSLVNFWLLMDQIPEFKGFLQKLEDDVQLLLVDDKYKKAVKNATTSMITHGVKLAKIDKESKHSVIQQGDAWTNNILFRFQNEKPIECCMIDYQASRQSNPVADIHYMIFNCTDHETRLKHYNDWIDYYHSQLDQSLANFGLKANYVYPRDQLDADLRRFGKVSLGQSIMLGSILVRQTEDAAKMKEAMKSTEMSLDEMVEQSKLSATDPETIQKYKNRVEGVIDSFLEFGYL